MLKSYLGKRKKKKKSFFRQLLVRLFVEDVDTPASRAKKSYPAQVNYKQNIEKLPVVYIEPETPEMREQSLLKRRRIAKQRFIVGRCLRDGVSYGDHFPDLRIAEDPPYSLSRNHCVIELQPTNRVIVKNLSTHTGVIVDGEKLQANGHHSDEIVLTEGEHVLIFGHSDSPARFKLSIRPNDVQQSA